MPIISLNKWIEGRKNKLPTWEIPENTMDFIKGIECDLSELSNQLGKDVYLSVKD